MPVLYIEPKPGNGEGHLRKTYKELRKHRKSLPEAEQADYSICVVGYGYPPLFVEVPNESLLTHVRSLATAACSQQVKFYPGDDVKHSNKTAFTDFLDDSKDEKAQYEQQSEKVTDPPPHKDDELKARCPEAEKEQDKLDVERAAAEAKRKEEEEKRKAEKAEKENGKVEPEVVNGGGEPEGEPEDDNGGADSSSSGNSGTGGASNMSKQELRFILGNDFDENELRELVRKLYLNYDTDIDGINLKAKVHNLVGYMAKRDRLVELEREAQKLLPGAFQK